MASHRAGSFDISVLGTGWVCDTAAPLHAATPSPGAPAAQHRDLAASPDNGVGLLTRDVVGILRGDSLYTTVWLATIVDAIGFRCYQVYHADLVL